MSFLATLGFMPGSRSGALVLGVFDLIDFSPPLISAVEELIFI
jgi:hypothetical protein